MTVAMEDMKKEVGRLKGHIVSQGEELLRIKRATGEDGSHLGSKRLQDIECELGEQKKSTAKITKLCLAAIKALESLEKRSSVDITSMEGSVASLNSVSTPVDPMIIKTICEQLDVINKLLIKVDDDIESVDQKAESALADYEDMDRRILDFEQKLRESKDTTMGEVQALLVSRTYATREDVSRAAAQAQGAAQAGLGKEEVAAMIERATSNFLKTMKADTASCNERTQDCEELVKKEVSRLSANLQLTDTFARSEARQVQENSDKSMKEVARTLAGLVEQHRAKANTENAEAFDRLNRRLDNEVKNFSEMVKEVKDLGLKEADESKLLSRLERLGRDVSGLKAEQVKLSQGVDSCLGKAAALETQTKTVTKTVEQQKEDLTKLGRQRSASKDRLGKEEATKLGRIETAVSELGQRLERQKEDVKKLGNLETTVTELGHRMEACKEKLGKEDTTKLSKLETIVIDLGKTIESQRDEGKKIGKNDMTKMEKTVTELGQRMDSTGRLADTLVAECSRKVDKTELDDIRNGMEKERCKINYFQDKILNIAKVAESARTDNISLKDMLLSEVGGTTSKIQNLAAQVEKQSTGIKENSDALKGITKDSIGKIKEVASNCVQIETNLRSIREKSIIFDNELKQIKDKIAQTEYKLENKDQDGAKEVKKMMIDREVEVKKMSEDIESMKKKVQLNVMELGNFREDRRTKEAETEERQLSLEQNLLEVRTYVERMLQETGKQLTGIAGEVEAADRKIARCAADIVDVLDRQENSKGTSSQAVSSLEAQLKELAEQEVMRKVEWAGELLEIKSSSNDTKAEVLGKVEAAGEMVARLRKETNAGLERLDGLVAKANDAGAVREAKAGAGLTGRLEGVEGKVVGLGEKLASLTQGLEGGVRAEVKNCSDSLTKVHLKVDGLQQAEENRAAQVRSVKEALAKAEQERDAKREEDSGKVAILKEELEGVVRTGEVTRKEVENRVENMRKNMIEMIGVNEMKTSELSEKVDRSTEEVEKMKIIQKNSAVASDEKVKAVKDDFNLLLNDQLSSKSTSTLDLEKVTAGLRKELEQVKTDLRNNDLESFKNIVNSTNDTHNKLISSIQKNVDLIIREKGQQEGLAAAMEEKITKVSTLREAGEQEVKKMIQKEQELRQQVDEKVQAVQVSMREVQGGVEGVIQLQTGLTSLKQSVTEAKAEMVASVGQQQARMTELENLLNGELTTLAGSGQTMQQGILDDFSEVSKTMQEKSVMADTSLNEALEQLHGQTRQLDQLKESVEGNQKSCQSSEAELQKVDFKVKSCMEEMAKMDQFAGVQERLAKLSQDTAESLREMSQKQASLGSSVTGVQAEVSRLTDMSGLTEDLSVMSSKVNQQKAKLIDIEANVTLQERSSAKLSEDVKKIGSNQAENIIKVEEKLEKMEGVRKELLIKVSDVEKTTSFLSQEMSSLTGLKTKVPVWDRKAETAEVDRLNKVLTEEVNKIQKEIKEMRKGAEDIQKEVEGQTKKGPVEVEVSRQQFQELDGNISRLSGVVESLQGQLTGQQDSSAEQLEQVNIAVRGLRKGLDTLSHESKQSGALGMIDKQRRGWEEAREKAEQMSQIFDSLIITNDRPYVSCGLEAPATCPGLVDFSQFELINKVGWDAQDLMFTMLEPGVYLLQMGGSLSGANVVAKMVNDDVEAEVVTLEGGKESQFRCRSTIFTVEDDDQTAERLLVEVVEHGDEEVRLEKDFALILHKISEVSQAEGPECLNGDFIKA